jgi:hypothetical protein
LTYLCEAHAAHNANLDASFEQENKEDVREVFGLNEFVHAIASILSSLEQALGNGVDQEVDDVDHKYEKDGTDANDEIAALDLCLNKRIGEGL